MTFGIGRTEREPPAARLPDANERSPPCELPRRIEYPPPGLFPVIRREPNGLFRAAVAVKIRVVPRTHSSLTNAFFAFRRGWRQRWSDGE